RAIELCDAAHGLERPARGPVVPGGAGQRPDVRAGQRVAGRPAGEARTGRRRRVPVDRPGPLAGRATAADADGAGAAVHDADVAGRRAGRAAVEGDVVSDHTARRWGGLAAGLMLPGAGVQAQG